MSADHARSDDLAERLAELARLPVLLVASDYDGTLAEIVEDPAKAVPHREALVALRSLAALPQTHVAVISGRALEDLARFVEPGPNTHLVGSHGSEFDLAFQSELAPDAVRLRERVEAELARIAGRFAGAEIEPKPASVALHYRNVTPAEQAALVDEVERDVARTAGVHVRHGKKVVELAVVATDKGRALETLRHRVGASGAVFFGDDVTDEDAFATLAGPDVAVKVGDGDTRAAHRVAGPIEVTQALGRLCELRAAWLAGSAAVPIEHHSFLSDQRTAALVTPDARVTWFCAPRLDSPALFAELLGGETAGRFTIGPVDGAAPLSQAYLPGTLVLETRFPGFAVTDYLDVSGGRPARRAGRSDLVRVVTGSGSGRATGRVVYAPRMDFGRVATRLVQREGGLAIEGSADPVVLHAPDVAWTIEQEGAHDVASGTFTLGERPVVFELRFGTPNLKPGVVPEAARRDATLAYWRSFSEALEIPDVAAELVRTSALVLKGLCYGPTGGVYAAGTTSLPEHVGGVRNWDYRFVWLRDAALAVEALAQLGSHHEAMQYLDWVLGVLDTIDGPERLHPLYTATGNELSSEGEIAELSGYAGSRPVRIGNAAAQQVQLDVFGPIASLVHTLAARGAPLSSEHARLVEALVSAVGQRWQEPDHGIWEPRRPPRHNVHSKVMCWVTVDRAAALARDVWTGPRADWEALAERIKADVLAHGWKPDRNAFTAAYDGDDLDAAALQVGLSGMLAPDDARFVGTVEAIERELRDGPTVYRYHTEDGLPGPEGGFHLLASWLVDAYLAIGRRDDARALFDELVGLAGPTGLYSEQVDPATRRALGNHPQAYSHIGLIHNALNLARNVAGAGLRRA